MAYKALFDESRGFGVEIEVCASSDYGLLPQDIEKCLQLNGQWRVTQDASIQGELPLEIISPVLYGTCGLLELSDVFRFLRKIKCTVNRSCGLHVHWDASNFSGNNVLSLLKFYTKFEPVIDNLMEPHRRCNNCKHAQTLQKQTDLNWIDQLGEDRLAVEIASDFQELYGLSDADTIPTARNHKVNICSLLKYNTIEFRQHHATLDSQQAVDWIVVTQLMLNKARETAIDSQMRPYKLTDFIRSLGINRYQDNQLSDRLKERYKNNGRKTECTSRR